MKFLKCMLTVLLMAALLCGCGGPDETVGTEPSQTETTLPPTETTEETIPGYQGEQGKPLTVDITTPGVVAEEPAPLGSSIIVLNGVTMQMPVTVSTLLENGWSFYSEEMSQQTVSASTETGVMGFGMSLNGQPYLNVSEVRNDSTSDAPISQCVVTRLSIDILNHEGEDGFDFVLPGGITSYSTAADIIAAYGPAQKNTSFDYVRTGTSLLYYSVHMESGLCYAFHFNEDGTLVSVVLSY